MLAFQYLRERFQTLRPTYDHATNPLRILASLTWSQWKNFLIGFFAWTWDAFDFHTVTINYPELSKTFNKSTTQISVGVTLVLMFRPLGAAIFGFAADRFGRKAPFIVNCILLIIFELATGFCHTYSQFLAVRALFGFAMGGIYGNAAATALEDLDEAARGFMSGIFQSGTANGTTASYPFGYLLATVFQEALSNNPHGWKALFWLGAGPPVLLIVARYYMDDTATFKERIPQQGAKQDLHGVLADIKFALERYGVRLLYLVFLMTGFSFMSHGTQDLYPLMLRNKYNFTSSKITRIQATANVGAFLGGSTFGYASQILGRRFTIIVACVVGAALLQPYTFSSGPGLYAAAFFEQFCVQGAFGVIPIHLVELSPPAFRTFVVGTSYHMGTLIASASNSIEAKIGERYPLPTRDGENLYDYSLVICIFAACVFLYNILVTSVGPERKGLPLNADDADDNEEEEVQPDTELDPWGLQQSSNRTRTHA